MEVSISALIAQVINFGIMFFLFSKFAAKPLSQAIENRRSLIKKLEKADDAYAQKIQEANKEAEKIIKESLGKKDAIIAQGGIVAEQMQKEIVEAANMKARKIVDDAQNQIQTLENDMAKEFSKGVKATSLLVVKKLLGSDKQLKQEYLDNIVQEMSK